MVAPIEQRDMASGRRGARRLGDGRAGLPTGGPGGLRRLPRLFPLRLVYSDRQKTRKKQTDDGGSGGRLNPSRFLFRLAFLSWPLVPVRRIALFFQDS